MLTRKILPKTFLALVLTIVIASVEMTSIVPVIAQTDPTPTVFLSPPTINGTVVGQEFTVNLSISNAQEIMTWVAGMTFNATLLNCTEYKEGEFLKSAGLTTWLEGVINNTTGEITYHSSTLLGDINASGDGRLAYLTFKVKSLGISDIHLRDVKVGKKEGIPIVEVKINIIDVYTVVLDTTPHTIVTVSNSTGKTGKYSSGFYAHAYNPTLNTLSFHVTGPNPGYSNVTIPKSLLNASSLDDWKVLIDGELVNRTVSENATHSSLYFVYSIGIHEVQITTRVGSVISIALSSTDTTLGSNVTISGEIDPMRPNVNVTIQSRPIGGNWVTLDTVETNLDSNYSYIWTVGEPGTHEVKASWDGDDVTVGDESDVLTLRVLAIYVFEPVQSAYVVIGTNSTVSAFDFNQLFNQIGFNVTTQHGTIGFSNVTIPKSLLNASSLDDWKVLIDGELVNRTVSENATHSSLYFVYSIGIHEVQITTRVGSVISIALSSTEIDQGESVTISGNVTSADDVARAYVNVTIRYRSTGVADWDVLMVVETDENGNYSFVWTPDAAGTYEVMARWDGDSETLPDETDALTLTVMESSTLSIALSSTNITFGSNVTISGSINPLMSGKSVYIQYKLIGAELWTAAGQSQTDQDSSYVFTWTPDAAGTYEVRATWLGDGITYGATSNVLILATKRNSAISIALGSTEIDQGESVTISGNVTSADDVARAYVNVTIRYRSTGVADWAVLMVVETDENGNYSFVWTPDAAGTYEVMARWEGDSETLPDETDALTLTVIETSKAGVPLEILAATVVAIIVIVAVAIYFFKLRKPR